MVTVIKEVKKQSPISFEQAIALNQSIIESTADGILVIDLYGKVVTYNKKFQELWGIPRSLASTRDDKKLLKFVLDQLEDPKGFIKKVNELYDHPKITSFDTLKFKDGRIFERYSQPQMIGEEIVGRVWSFRDVSKEKELEESLRKSKERFYSHIENLSLIVVGLDTNGTVIYANATLCNLFGLDKKEILGRNWIEEFIPERCRLEIMEVSEREIESELHPNSEIKIMIVEDEFVTASGLKTSLEELGYFVSATVPSGEEAVKKAEEDKPDLVLMDIELSGKMDGIEAAGTIHSRFKIPSIYLTAYADQKILDRAKITEPFGYILKPFEKRELHSNIEMALYKHKAEQELKKLNQELLEKEELKAIAKMAVTASHEINNPLTSVMGFVEYLQSEKDLSEEEKEKTLNVIHKEASRISNVLKRFSKIIRPVKKIYSGDTDMIDLEKSKYKE